VKNIAYLFILFAFLYGSEALAQRPTGGFGGGSGGGFGGFGSFGGTSGFGGSGGGFGGGFGGQGGGGQSLGRGKDGGPAIDDSTKVIYGPKSVRFYFEQDIFNNLKINYNPDTLLSGSHRFNFIAQRGDFYQDLGNMGTAMQSLFYLAPAEIGELPGFRAFTPYKTQPSEIKYYNTKSPYTQMYFITGGAGQNILRWNFARNVDSLWNVGFNLQRTTSFKQYGFNSGRITEDFLTENWNFILHTNLVSRNKKYTLLAHVNHFSHTTTEQGGATSPDNPEDKDLLLGRNNNTSLLTVAAIKDVRNHIHAYHQYTFTKGLQAYHVFDWQFENYGFKDAQFLSNIEGYYKGLYPNRKVPKDTAFYGADYTSFKNKFGLKGFYKGFNYRSFVKLNLHGFVNERDSVRVDTVRRLAPAISRQDLSVGLWLNQYFKDSTKAFAEFEYIFGRDFQLRAEYFGKKLIFGGYFVSSSPTFFQQKAVGNFYFWDNDFANTTTTQLYVSGNKRIKNLLISGNAEFTLAKNLIYFDESASPVQETGEQLFYRLGFGLEWRKKRWEAVGKVNFTTSTGAEVIRFPKIYLNGRVGYDFRFAKVLYVQMGLEFTFLSAYKADTFNPSVMQFVQQNEYTTKDYLMTDFFANFRINRTRLFLKMSNINQFWGGGYFVRPYYPLIGPTFGFGVNWLLFD
jgi:hypothetical protein